MSFFESPQRAVAASPVTVERKGFASSPLKSPSKRTFLGKMSPNVSRRIVSGGYDKEKRHNPLLLLQHLQQQLQQHSSHHLKHFSNSVQTSSGVTSRNVTVTNVTSTSTAALAMASTSSSSPPANADHSYNTTSVVAAPPTGISTSTSISKKPSRFERPTLGQEYTSHLPTINSRSMSTALIFLQHSVPGVPSMSNQGTSLSRSKALRRTNSLISTGGSSSTSDKTQQQLAVNSSDRFIPSRHNSTTGKLQCDEVKIDPNASPETHIKAQTSKIYQHHVAEACGLEVNSRVLQFQPLPPERKRPMKLFDHITSTSNLLSKIILNGRSLLKPSAASARAKKVPTAPERVLDAPGIVDDFYLNLIAWSHSNLLAIGLEDAVYVWNASTGSVGLLCELKNTIATSLKWSEDGSYISIGRNDGLIEIWDIETNTKLRTLAFDHNTRIASHAWQLHILTSGSRIGHLYNSDVRVPNQYVFENKTAHLAEICGISYKPEGQQLCTGGNDNLVCLWDVRQSSSNNTSTNGGSGHSTINGNNSGYVVEPIFTKTNHKAAVKAISWCPYQLSLLATGGGSSDKSIHFWNTSTGARIHTIETCSQISSLNWGYASGIGMEIVATHGFPTNNISIFNYPTLQKTGEIINAHDSRILSGCLSPDSLTLATVAGDENLKFWSLFDLYKAKKRPQSSTESMSNDDKRIKKMMNLR